tara:strand:+ start:368 stop:565 length:198 start_codon:yes stop_codon:yes gene_type:complete
MEDTRYRVNKTDILDIVEQEMIQLWLSKDTIPLLCKEDEEFVGVITSAIMLERSFWSKFMEVGEA